MNTPTQILHDLKAGQSTIASILHRLPIPRTVLAAYLQDLELDGLVESVTIKDTIQVWRLTHDGLALIAKS